MKLLENKAYCVEPTASNTTFPLDQSASGNRVVLGDHADLVEVEGLAASTWVYPSSWRRKLYTRLSALSLAARP